MKRSTIENMCEWEQDKAVFILRAVRELDIMIEDNYTLAVNPNSGYTYFWQESLSFSLYMPINCELDKKDIYVLWSNPEDGEETEKRLSEFTDIHDIYNWIESLEKSLTDEA